MPPGYEASWGRQRCDSPSYQNASPRPLQFHQHSADGRWGRHAPVLQRALQRTRQYQVQGRAVAAAAAAESTHRRNRPASRDGKNHPQHSELEKCTFHTEARNCFLKYFSPLGCQTDRTLEALFVRKRQLQSSLSQLLFKLTSHVWWEKHIFDLALALLNVYIFLELSLGCCVHSENFGED